MKEPCAGATKDEISFVLKENFPNEKTEFFLRDYIQSL